MRQSIFNTASLSKLVLIGCCFAVSINSAQAAALYKWIDENGEVRYSDRVPPTQADKKRHTLNKQGMVIGTREAAKSREELAAEAAAREAREKKLAEDTRLKQAQDKKDRVLLLTFSSEQEMNNVRDNRIEVIESVIRLINTSIEATEKRLEQLRTTADNNYISKGKEVPGGLAQNIEHFSRKVASRNEQLRLKQKEKRKISQQFELDLARYRELKSRPGN